MPGSPARWALVLGCFLGSASVLVAVLVAPRYDLAAAWVVGIDAFLVGGLWASRQQPRSRSAHWLLLTGLVASAWYVLTMVELLWYAESGAKDGLRVLNLLAVGLDVALPASVMVLLATYPHGRTSRGAARAVLWLAITTVVAVPALALVGGSRLVPAYVLVWNEDVTTLPGLFAWGGPASLRDVALTMHQMALAVLPLAGALFLLAGYRRLGTADRVRVRWLGLAGLIVAADGVFSGVPALDVIPGPVSIILIGTFPLLAAVGIARPDLLDVDEALRRSALFAVLWAGSSLAYLGTANALGVAAADRGARAAVPVAVAATLAFYPVWRWLVRVLSRRLVGITLDGDELLRRVGQMLEHSLEPAELAGAMAETIREGLGVSWARVSLDGHPVATAGLPEESEQAAARTDLWHEGRSLGRIECGPRPTGRTLRPADKQRLLVLGRQLGLAAHNARLAAELSASLERIKRQAADLDASRARIVTAEERGRRRIQRDIHDGIQQELVAIIGRVGLLEAQARRDPAAVVPRLPDLRMQAGRALDDLRELARGIHPSVLADRGLVEALESRAAALPLGVTFEGGDRLRDTRLPPLTESALYFTASEALTNAMKHSGAREVLVRLCHEGAVFRLEVHDDGCGFAPGSLAGGGLEGIADRLEALGGMLTVDSRPGAGTTLVAELPLLGEVARV